MDQKNRLLREAFTLLTLIATGISRPLGYDADLNDVLKLTERIGKNLKLTPAAKA